MGLSAILQRGKHGSGPTHPGGPESVWGVDRWAPFPDVAAPWQQVGHGAYWLNQLPAYYNQPQLHSGVEWQDSRWYTPTVSVLPTFEQTQRPTNIAGGQRFGLAFSGPTGPLNARRLFARVNQSQLAQSGAGALSWASQLTGS